MIRAIKYNQAKKLLFLMLLISACTGRKFEQSIGSSWHAEKSSNRIPRYDPFFDSLTYGLSYRDHIVDMFCKENPITLKEVIAFAEKYKPHNQDSIKRLEDAVRRGMGGISFNGPEDFDTVLYGIRYESIHIK